MAEVPVLNEEEMQNIYNWVDEIPLSRPKRNIARDFSDGVLVAEIIKHFYPHMVELHNYSGAHSVSQKTYNWNTLNQKVFKKLGFTLNKKNIEDVVNCVPDMIERILSVLMKQLEIYAEKKKNVQGTSTYNQGPQLNQSQFTQQQNLNKENNNAYGGINGIMQQQNQQFQEQMRKQNHAQLNQVDADILADKDQTIMQLKETVEILELKIKKLDQLVKLKDTKIQNLTNKLQSAGIL